MGDGFIVRRGGGKLKFLTSLITVTYPEGSTCTCTNGTKTLKAKDTSGKALFNVDVGTWTVSCTDGTETASQTVEITAEGQSKNVTLDYGFYVIRDGKTDLSISFDANSSAVGKVEEDCIALYSNESIYNNITLKTTPAVDLTKYSTARILLENTDNQCWVGFGTGQGDYSAVNFFKNGTLEKQFVDLDISNLSGAYYFSAKHNYNGILKIYTVWLF